MTTRENFLMGKGGQGIGLTTLPSSYADCHEIWVPHPPGTHRACTGIALPFAYVLKLMPSQVSSFFWVIALGVGCLTFRDRVVVSSLEVKCPMSLDKHPLTVSNIPEEQICQPHLSESLEVTFLIWRTNITDIGFFFFFCATRTHCMVQSLSYTALRVF